MRVSPQQGLRSLNRATDNRHPPYIPPTSFPVSSRVPMSLVPLVAVVMIFAIPILGILFAGYKEWLEFKAEHRALETTPREVETQLRTLRDRLATLEEERDALQERVQNLETIVTSEAWIAGHDATEGAALEESEIDSLALPPERNSDDTAATTAEIARRLRGQ